MSSKYSEPLALKNSLYSGNKRTTAAASSGPIVPNNLSLSGCFSGVKNAEATSKEDSRRSLEATSLRIVLTVICRTVSDLESTSG